MRQRHEGVDRLGRDVIRLGTCVGLLCFRCNAALRVYMTADWLRRALAYLERGAGTTE